MPSFLKNNLFCWHCDGSFTNVSWLLMHMSAIFQPQMKIFEDSWNLNFYYKLLQRKRQFCLVPFFELFWDVFISHQYFFFVEISMKIWVPRIWHLKNQISAHTTETTMTCNAAMDKDFKNQIYIGTVFIAWKLSKFPFLL